MAFCWLVCLCRFSYNRHSPRISIFCEVKMLQCLIIKHWSNLNRFIRNFTTYSNYEVQAWQSQRPLFYRMHELIWLTTLWLISRTWLNITAHTLTAVFNHHSSSVVKTNNVALRHTSAPYFPLFLFNTPLLLFHTHSSPVVHRGGYSAVWGLIPQYLPGNTCRLASWGRTPLHRFGYGRP